MRGPAGEERSEERERAAQVAAAVAWTAKGMEEDGGKRLELPLPGRRRVSPREDGGEGKLRGADGDGKRSMMGAH